MSITLQVPENVYRFPYEFYSSAVYSLAAFSLYAVPVPVNAQMIASAGLVSMAAVRLKQGRRIRRYRKNLSRLPFYGLTSNQIPVSDKALFIGKGFEWTQTHTQRLLLARLPQNRKLVTPGKAYQWVRKHEILTNGKSWLAKQTVRDVWWNPVAPLPPVGGSPEIHGVEPDDRDIYMDLGERVGHVFVVGTTRVGKTRLAEILIKQDIARKEVVITFDPKGDADLMEMHYIEAQKAGRPFYLFHLGFPEISCRYNPIGNYTRITEVATRVANQLPDEGQSSAFRDFVWRFVNVLTKIMEALSIKPDYVSIYQHAINIDDLAIQYFKHILDNHKPDWREQFEDYKLNKSESMRADKNGRSMEAIRLSSYLVKFGLHDDLCNSVNGILNNERSYFEKLVSSLYPLLEKLNSGKVAELISPEFIDLTDPRPIMDWRKAINENAVIYIGLDALTDTQVASAVGNAMLADLTSLSGQIYKFGHGYGQSDNTGKRCVNIHVDEFNEIAGDEFIPMLNKAGGAGFRVTAYTQTVPDIEAKVGSKPKAQQMLGNFNTLIMLRVKEQSTAELLTRQLPDVRVITGTLTSGAGDIAYPEGYEDFTSRNEDRLSSETVPMLSPADVYKLPKGQAFALIEGGRLYKLRLPLPVKDPNDKIPDGIKQMAEEMRDKYRLSQAVNDDGENAFVEGRYYA